MEVITVTSTGQNPSSFISNFTNSVHLSDGYEVGLIKMASPAICNVTQDNNKLYIVKKDDSQMKKVLEIPHDFYPTSHDLAQAIQDVLTNNIVSTEDDSQVINFKSILKYHGSSGNADHSKVTLQLTDKKSVFSASKNDEGNVLHLLEFRIKNFTSRSLVIQNYDLSAQDQICFVYSSIVSNSLIDYNVSRLLDTVAIKSSKNGGYFMLEVQNPVFHDISSSSFIDISFEIRSALGNLVQFVSDRPVILTLGIRKKLVSSI